MMKKMVWALVALVAFAAVSCESEENTEPRNADNTWRVYNEQTDRYVTAKMDWLVRGAGLE